MRKGRREKRRLPIAAAAAAQVRQAVPCLACALCCSYVAVPIEAPDTLQAATEILWQLYHEHVSVYRDSEDEWMVQFETRCRHLASDNRCRIYETRPPICRSYSEQTCEVNAEDEGQSFYSPESFLTYLAGRSRRVHALIQKQYMPGPEHLAARTPSRQRLPPAFEQRFAALRARPSQPIG